MNTFEGFKIKKQLQNAIVDLGFDQPTPIQQESYSPILGGNDFVGIAQTGTGKTMAYMLPILQELNYSEQHNPRIVILVPTRELVIQIVKHIELLTAYLSVRVTGVYGGSNNIGAQTIAISEGVDIIVGTPRRFYDLIMNNIIRLKSVKKVVIDEVDIMLDFGYKTQLNNIFEHLPTKRQNILFSATMTSYVDDLIDDFLVNPIKKTISLSGTPVDTIRQESYEAPNFYTKANLLNHLLKNKEEFNKVLIFAGSKLNADRLFETLNFKSDIAVIHSGKEQNHRTKSIEKFEDGSCRILIATDVIARGIDIDKISTVISFDTPFYPENYIHRIGRTGRAGEKGTSILLFSEKEHELKNSIEALMNYEIPLNEFPDEVMVSSMLTPEEKLNPNAKDEFSDNTAVNKSGPSFHEKSKKNSKVKVERKSYPQQLKERYKKPIRRGDKIQNMKKKNKKK
jgi:ATP-dependent RNA helicase RhlE